MISTNCDIWDVRFFRRRSRNCGPMLLPARNSWWSGSAGATACTKLSLTSRNSRQRDRSQQRVSPGGKKERLPFQSLQQERRQEFGLQPGPGRIRVVLGQLAHAQQAFEPFEDQ